MKKLLGTVTALLVAGAVIVRFNRKAVEAGRPLAAWAKAGAVRVQATGKEAARTTGASAAGVVGRVRQVVGTNEPPPERGKAESSEISENGSTESPEVKECGAAESSETERE